MYFGTAELYTMIRAVLILLSILFAWACQRELEEPKETIIPPQPPVVTTKCRITTCQYYGFSGNLTNSGSFTYTNGLLTRMDTQDKYILYRFANELPVVLRYYNKPAGKMIRQDSVLYASGKVAAIYSHVYDPAGIADTSLAIYSFNYSSDRLANIQRISTVSSSTYQDTTLTTYQYNGLGNAVQAIMKNSFRSPDTIRYEYDEQANFFQKMKPFFISDPFFRLQNGFEPQMPYFFSKNNVSRYIMYAGTVNLPVTYRTDSSNNPVLIRLGNQDAISYKWTCQ